MSVLPPQRAASDAGFTILQPPSFAAFLFVLLVVLAVVGATWVGAPGRQYDRDRLRRAVGE